MSLSLQGSATIREIIIDNPSGFAPNLSSPCKKVFVNIALTSLLSTEMRIERVDIHRLVLSIQRTKEGLFNFRHILKHLKSTSPPSSEKPVPVKAQPAKGIFLNLFKAEEVQISFEDYAFSESPILTELKRPCYFTSSLFGIPILHQEPRVKLISRENWLPRKRAQ